MRLKKCTPDADPETNCDVTAWVAHTLPYEEKDYILALVSARAFIARWPPAGWLAKNYM